MEAEWVNASANVALVAVAGLGFLITIHTVIQGRNRQRQEIEGYVRVDIGPPDGTPDYSPPAEISFVESRHLAGISSADEARSSASEADTRVICAWYRNLQKHPIGVALGIAARISVEAREGDYTVAVSQNHDIAYIEPGKCVRVDIARFPSHFEVNARLEAIRYRNLDWDGTTPRHGRTECRYAEGRFTMVPWSDPSTSLRDWLGRIWTRINADTSV